MQMASPLLWQCDLFRDWGETVLSDATPDPYTDPLVFGQRLQILRTRKGLTRDQLGGLVGPRESGSWVKGVETGRLKTPKLEVVLRLAEILRVRDLSDLTGDQSVHVDLFTGPGHARLPEVKAAVDASPSAPDGRPRRLRTFVPGWRVHGRPRPLAPPGRRGRTAARPDP